MDFFIVKFINGTRINADATNDRGFYPCKYVMFASSVDYHFKIDTILKNKRNFE